VHSKNLASFFNRFKTEIVNMKLNCSMVNLAIKNIILAVEKISKIQRVRKALVFRKLNLAIWGKQQLDRDCSTITTLWDNQLTKKESFKLNNLSSTESIVFRGPKFQEEEHNRKITRFASVVEKIILNDQRSGLRAIQSFCRIEKLAQGLQFLGSSLFKKIIYKRSFLAFAQIKYFAIKRQQKIQSRKFSGLLSALQIVDKIIIKNKKAAFKDWKSLVRSEIEHLRISSHKFSQVIKKRSFEKWKLALNKRLQRKTQIQSGLARIQAVSEKKLKKFVKWALKRIMKNKIPKSSQISNRSIVDQSSLILSKKASTGSAKVKTAKSPRPYSPEKKT